MPSRANFLLSLVLLSSIYSSVTLAYLRMDMHGCRRMCSLEGHSPTICAAECWWPQMHVEAERLCHQACRIRGISDDNQCSKLCTSTPVRSIIPRNRANAVGFLGGVANGGNFFGRAKNHHAEIRVSKGAHIGIGQRSEILLPVAGLQPEELSAPDWGAQDCSCSNPVGPTRLEFGLMGGRSTHPQGGVRIQGWLCPELGCFYEEHIPPPADLRYNVPIRVEWQETVVVRKAHRDRPEKTRKEQRSVVMTFRKQGNLQYQGPVMAGDTVVRCDLDGKPLTHRMTFKKTIPLGIPSIWFGSTTESRVVDMEAITLQKGGSCGNPGSGVFGGPTGRFYRAWYEKETTKKGRTRRVCHATAYSYTIIDPLSVVLDGTHIN